MDLYARKATFAAVRQDLKAVQFHQQRYKNGSVDLLAKQCYQHWMQLQKNPDYKILISKMEEER